MCLGTVSVWSLYAYVTEAFRSGLSILLHFICEPKHVWQPTTKCFVISMYICSMMISYLINYAGHKAQKGKTPDGC